MTRAMLLAAIVLASLALARSSSVPSTVGPSLSSIGSPTPSTEPSPPNDDEAIDEGLYSRQLCVAIRARSDGARDVTRVSDPPFCRYVLGRDAQRKLARSSVLLIGCGPVGAEVSARALVERDPL